MSTLEARVGTTPAAGRTSWALARGARRTWERFREDSAAIPRAAWMRGFVTLTAGFVLTTLLMVVTIRTGRYLVENGMQAWDRKWLLRVEEIEALSFQRAIWLEVFGSSSFLLPLVGLGAIIAVWMHQPLRAAGIVAAYALHDPIVMFGWSMWDRARPDLIAGGIAAPALHSYPSGHAVNVVATFGFLAYLWARASGSWIERFLAFLLVAVLAATVGIARVRMGVHWPSDIIAGAVIGAAWLAVMMVADHRAQAAAHG